MRNSKRFLALCLALALCLSLIVCAAAMPGDMGGAPPAGGMPGGMGGPPGMGGSSVNEADLPAAEAITYGPYESLTITAIEYDPAYVDYVDSTRYAQITKISTDQGEIAVDNSLYTPVLTWNGCTWNLATLELPFTAEGTFNGMPCEASITLVNKGLYSGGNVAKFGADNTSQIGDLYHTAAVYVSEGKYNADRSIPAAQISGSEASAVTDTGAKDLVLVSEGDYLEGFYINNSDYTVDNVYVNLNGKGGDDFNGIGSALVATGSANVTINGSYFETAGVLRSGIWAGGSANVYINDTVVISHNDFDFVPYNTEDNFATPMMQQVPFALGMTGNIRATLVCGQAKNWFTNCLVTSSGWAVLSTDSGSGGLDATNTVAVLGFAEEYDAAKADDYTEVVEIGGTEYGVTVGVSDRESPYFASGYVAYCDGFTDYSYGSRWYAPDYLAIVTGGYLEFDGLDGDGDGAIDARGYGYCDRIGFMTHQSNGSEIVLNNADFDIADTFIMTKNKSGNYNKLSLTDVNVNLYGEDPWSGVLYQFMDSDDLGDGPGATAYTIPYYTYDQYLAGTGTPAGTTTLAITDSDITGNVYNATAYYQGASSTGGVELTLDGSALTGAVSSAYAYHVDATGEAITGGDDQTFTVDCYTGTGDGGPDGETYDYLTIGRIVNTAAPTRGNPVSVTLTNGSVWNVTGESYVAALTVDETSEIVGEVTELPDGTFFVAPEGTSVPEAPEAPFVIPEAGEVVVTSQKLTINGQAVTPAAYNIDGYNYFKLRDMAALLANTDAKFSVAFDEAANQIVLVSGEGYDKQAGDLQAVSQPVSTVPSPQSVYANGADVQPIAYNIDGSNYFKLRDLGDILGFGVDYDEATATMLIQTPGYDPEAAPPPAEEAPAQEAPADGAAQSIKDMTVSTYSALDPDSSRSSKDTGHIYVGYDVVDGALVDGESNWKTEDVSNIVFDNEVEGYGFTALHASGANTNVKITGSLNLHDSTQGYYASDFTGTGVAVVATDAAKVFATGLDLVTDGFVRAAFISYKGAVVYIDDSNIVTYGSNPLTEAYEGYANSASTNKMISPPWVLGIQGGIRTVNVLGDSATLLIRNSYLASGGWGVLSTDGCSNPAFSIVDTELEVLSEQDGGMNSGYALFGYDPAAYGSGYGSYVIGNAVENFYGVTINGSTYAAIAREGTAIYKSSKGSIDLVAATGETIETIEGRGNATTINSTFGFLSHSGENVNIQVLDGTIVNTAEATFLYKTSATAEYIVDNAVLNPNSGILLQMLDDDDSTVGISMQTMAFSTALNEDAGLPSVSGNVTGSDGNSKVDMTMTNGTYAGDLFNGTGYYTQGGDILNLTIGAGAALTGDVALTQTIHGVAYSPEAVAALKALGSDVSYVFLDQSFAVTQDEAAAAYIQLTSFSINQYYCLGHVLNNLYYNGNSAINVTVKDGGVWYVEDTSYITCLTIAEGSAVYGALTQNADGTLTLTPAATALAAGTYGADKQPDPNASVGGMAMSPGMMGGAMGGPGGPPPQMP